MHCVECPVHVDSAAFDPGVAGASARRTYERLSVNREAEVRGLWGDRIGGWILRLTDEPQRIRAWDVGAAGEERLAETLDTIENIRVLHDRRIEGSRANIDHLVVAPTGIFVIDAKKDTGSVEIRDKGGWFRSDRRLYVGRRDRSDMAAGVSWQADMIAAAFEDAEIDPGFAMVPVLCFIGSEWPVFRRPREFDGVLLEYPSSLEQVLSQPGSHSARAIDALADLLAVEFPPR